MKDGDRFGLVFVAVMLIAIIVYCFAMGAYGKATRTMCQALGWQRGNSKGWFTGFCYEYGKGEWQYHSCDLPYVLAGECDPMWPDAE